jgi:hypothetical protein
MIGATKYIGIDAKIRVVEETQHIISSNRPNHCGRIEVISADAFSEQLWAHHLPRLHPQQFHVICAGSGFYRAFASVEKVRSMLHYISDALVPNGTFIGSITSPTALLSKGRLFQNSIFSSEWPQGCQLRVGNEYHITVEGVEREQYVVPLDAFIGIASEFGLSLIPESSSSFGEVLSRDPKWVRSHSPEEKEYLSIKMTFAFRKNSPKRAVQQ